MAPGVRWAARLACGGLHEAQIGSVIAQRGRHTDQDHLGVRDHRYRIRERQVAAPHPAAEQRLVHTGDHQLTTTERPDPSRVHVDAADPEARFRCRCGQRQPHVALAQDGDWGGARGDALRQIADRADYRHISSGTSTGAPCPLDSTCSGSGSRRPRHLRRGDAGSRWGR